jgi:hypothetical protein
MKLKYSDYFLLLLFSFPIFVTAQVGIGNTNPQGALDITTDTAPNPTNADGLLIPRVSLSDTTTATVITPTESELIYNTATINDVTPGYYYWDATKWIRLATGNLANNWSITGNAGTNATVNFIGTTDPSDFVMRTDNIERMRIRSNGNVGIGTTTPGVKMDLVGNIRVNVNNGSFRTYNFSPFLSTILLGGFNGTGGNKPQMRWTYDTSSNFFDEGLNSDGSFAIQVNDVDGLVIDANRNIGIGTSTPSTRLHIASNNTGTNATIESGNMQYPCALSILPSTHASSRRSAIKLDDWSILQDLTGTGTKDFTVYQSSTDSQRITIGTNGNVGIGINSPTEKLDINGKAKTTNFQMTNGASAGYVLQSDASGNASWTYNSPALLKTYSATAAVASPLTQNVTGALIYSENSGFPVFPEDLPDGFTCTIVNYSIFPNTSNTLTTAKFITAATGMSGASSFTMAPGETVNVYVITNTATLQKNYFIK